MAGPSPAETVVGTLGAADPAHVTLGRGVIPGLGGLVGLLSAYTTPRIAALGAVEFALYFALLVASDREGAARHAH